MSRSRSIAWFFRITILLVLFFWAYTLKRWSQRGDPRFYQFVNTGAGRVMARAFSWHRLTPDVPITEKSEAEMTEEELRVKRALEREVMSDLPVHRLEFKNGDEMLGRIIQRTPDNVTFSETYGESGKVTVTVPRADISKIERLTNAPPSISYRDVRFSMEFPGMKFYKRPPYTILTDESWFRVQHVVENLMRLYRQFVLDFGSLFTSADHGRDIQVVFFSDETRYREYERKYAPCMEGSSGFYSPWADRLIVFNQNTAQRVARARSKLAKEEARYRAAYSNQPRVLAQVDTWKQEAERNISQTAEQQTLSTIRHEGAHQLFFSFGVHSVNRIENEWLFEGLATYCETPRIGDKDPTRIRTLHKAMDARKLILLEKIVNLRSEGGLMSLGSPEQVELGSAEAWSLVHFLMTPPRKDAFFDYIRYLRDPKNFEEVRDMPRINLLCRFLGLTPEELDEQWRTYVAEL